MSSGEWLMLGRHGYQLKDYEEFCKREGYAYRISGRKESSIEKAFIRAILVYENARNKNIEVSLDEAKLLYKHAKIKNKATFHKDIEYYSLETLGFDKDINWLEALDAIPREDREYVRRLKTNGESLINEPRILISTIHASKGGEADNVVINTDISYRSYKSYLKSPQEEYRVFYTGITRTRKNLFIMLPQTNKYFSL